MTTVLPPGAQGAFGGYINDCGRVAGIYIDAAGTTLGLVYYAGHYADFRLPAGATNIGVQSVNAQGHIVGTFNEGNFQRVFVYNGTQIHVFGQFSNNDYVGVALNNVGEIIVADTGAANMSYRTKCEGSGC